MNKLLKFASDHVGGILSVLLILSGIGLCFSKLKDGQLTGIVTEHALPLILGLSTLTAVCGSILGLKYDQIFAAVGVCILLFGFLIRSLGFY